MFLLRPLVASVRDRLAEFVSAHLVWPLQHLLYYRLYARAQLAVHYRLIPALAQHLPFTRRPIDGFFREWRGYTACGRCGHTPVTCAFRGVAYPGHYLDDDHDPVHSIWSDHGFLCHCCWPLLDPPTRRAYARAADDRRARRRLARDLVDQRVGRGRWAPGCRGGVVTLERIADDPIAWALIEAACDDDRLRSWYDTGEVIDDALAAWAAIRSRGGLSAERLAEIRALVTRARQFWADEAEMEQAFAITADSDLELGPFGSLPPFEPAELQEICRSVFAARDLLAALDERSALPGG